MRYVPEQRMLQSDRAEAGHDPGRHGTDRRRGRVAAGGRRHRLRPRRPAGRDRLLPRGQGAGRGVRAAHAGPGRPRAPLRDRLHAVQPGRARRERGRRRAGAVPRRAEVDPDGALARAYSTADLSDDGVTVLSVTGDSDGVLDRRAAADNGGNLGEGARELVIPGGNHAQFGSYGPQDGDGEAGLPRRTSAISHHTGASQMKSVRVGS